PDIRESLASTRWDLVIVDEGHWISGTRADVLREVGAAAERVVLATASSFDPSDAFPLEDITVVDWRRDELVDQHGRPLDTVPRPALNIIPFILTQAE